ncbi:MAG TPA: hypothetical protein VMD91_13780 [Candidatus Sulfotelmatobacter sp.]|nr:hypothetical protein [Candidatus Sulfotelmatobacter sp.]
MKQTAGALGFALAVLLVAPSGSFAANDATPPPTIGGTHSKGFCDTVRGNVAPAVHGLMNDDALLGAGHRALAKMSHDAVTSTPQALDLDRVYLGKVVLSLAHNVGVIDKLLNDPSRFPKAPATDDDKEAALLQSQLRAARDRQNDALNLVDGLLETEQMGQMRSDLPSQIQSATGPSNATPLPASPTDPPNFLDTAGLPDYSPISSFDPRKLATSNTLGNTPYDHILRALDVDQGRIAAAEQALTPTVVAAAYGCGAGATPK